MAPTGGERTVDVVDLRPDDTSMHALPLLPFNEAKAKVIRDFEIDYLNRLMRLHKGDVVKAAKEIGKCRTGLWNLLSKYDIRPRGFC